MKNALALGGDKTTKFRDITSIMKDPAAKSKLSNYIDEAAALKLKIFTDQQTIKQIRDLAREELSLNPKLFNAYLGAVFNNDYVARRDDLQEVVTLLDRVIGLLPGDNSNALSHDDSGDE